MARRRIAAALAVLAVLAVLVPGGDARAEDSTETRLRDALRQAISQQRGLEDERARLQARLDEQDRLIQALKAQAEAPAARTVSRDGGIGPAGREILGRMEAEFNHRLAQQNETIGKAAEALEKWKKAYEQAVATAKATEAERAKLAEDSGGLRQKVETCTAKNVELYKVGTEILDRYAAMDLADALGDREPFFGFKRVELQTLVQDYQDQLISQKAIP